MRSRRAKSDRSTPHRWATITRLRAISVIGVLTLGVAAPTFTAQVQDAAAAPSAALVTSPSGRLSVSRSIGLEPAGATVQVNGTGFDTNKGIYVALCVIPSPGVAPSPCGGGIAMEGSTGASHWISSNPPSYGVGLAVPYGSGGTFSVALTVNSAISPTIDCRSTPCAITTRRDHMASGDRSQDELIPVTFGSTPTSPTTPHPTTPPSPTPTTPAATTPAATGPASGVQGQTGTQVHGSAAAPAAPAPSTDTSVTSGSIETVTESSVVDASTTSSTVANAEADNSKARQKKARGSETATALVAKVDSGDDGSSGSTVGLFIALLAAVMAVGGGGFVVVRRRVGGVKPSDQTTPPAESSENAP